MKKLLIATNEAEISACFQHFELFEKPALTRIISEIQSLNIGPVTQALVEDALFNSSGQISDLFRQQAQEDTEGIKSPVLRQNMLSGIESALEQFRLFVSESTGLCDRDILRHFTVKDETAILSEENKQEISEKFRTYLSPEQNELYQKLCKCAELLNEVFRGRKDEITHHTILQMFTLKDGVFEASTDVNFGYFLKQ